MRTKTKIWLITAASLVVIGCIIFGGVMSMLNWDFIKLSSSKYVTNYYEINEEYTNISIVSKTTDVVFVPSESQTTSVTFYEQKNNTHTVAVKDGTLEIAMIKKWQYSGFNFETPKITVHIPQGDYGALLIKTNTGDVKIPAEFKFESIDILGKTSGIANYASAAKHVKIKTTTGHISVENISASEVNLSVSTGDVNVSGLNCGGDVTVGVSTGDTSLSNVACKNIISGGSTGDIYLDNVIASEKMSIERSTGDVKFNSSDAAEIYVNTDTGDVRGNLLSEKVFITSTDTGKVDVPKSITGGRCEITTDTGDIKLEIIYIK